LACFLCAPPEAVIFKTNLKEGRLIEPAATSLSGCCPTQGVPTGTPDECHKGGSFGLRSCLKMPSFITPIAASQTRDSRRVSRVPGNVYFDRASRVALPDTSLSSAPQCPSPVAHKNSQDSGFCII
jgi:hypothetical protein